MLEVNLIASVKQSTLTLSFQEMQVKERVVGAAGGEPAPGH
jgi:hypothetical protein